MQSKTIDGKLLGLMLSGGAAMLNSHVSELNSLNVFPVADGDTGTNMYSTIEGGLAALNLEEESIGRVAASFARASLLSARGNSGVILSQIFSGLGEALCSLDVAGVPELCEAYSKGIETAYSAVQNPTEGTILTVFREATETAVANMTADSTVEDFYRIHLEEARRSLERTPELLPALAEAEVVDSGGAGYLYIAEGMYGALTGKLDALAVSVEHKAAAPDIDKFTRDSILEFGYCTEFLLRLTTAKVDPDSFKIKTIISDLTELSGESIVAYKQDDIIKVHVHTFTPGLILDRMQKYGEFLTLKIENMSLGHSESVKKKEKKKKKKKYATVTVATGEGLSALFSDMGADYIISGGQTANPSIEEFIKAFDSCNAENIFVLPNNKNILLAAEQAAAVYEGAKIHIIPTKNLMQGYAALSVINPTMADADIILSGAKSAMSAVIDGEITRAVRDVKIEGREIHEGDFMAISEGKIHATADSAEDAVLALLSECDTDLSEILTIFAGKEVDADRRVALTDRIAKEYPDLEITVYEGGQEVYDYLIALE